MDSTKDILDDRFSHYEHCLLVDTIPVRFIVDKKGQCYGAECAGTVKGALSPDPTLLSQRLKTPEDFTPISEDEFKQHLRDYEPRGPVTSSKYIADK